MCTLHFTFPFRTHIDVQQIILTIRLIKSTNAQFMMMILLFSFQIEFIAIFNLTGFSLKAKLEEKKMGWKIWMAKLFRRISDWINWLFQRMIWHFRTHSASRTNHSGGHVFGFCTVNVWVIIQKKNHFGSDISFERNQFCKNDKRWSNHGKPLNDFTRAEEKNKWTQVASIHQIAFAFRLKLFYSLGCVTKIPKGNGKRKRKDEKRNSALVTWLAIRLNLCEWKENESCQFNRFERWNFIAKALQNLTQRRKKLFRLYALHK